MLAFGSIRCWLIPLPACDVHLCCLAHAYAAGNRSNLIQVPQGNGRTCGLYLVFNLIFYDDENSWTNGFYPGFSGGFPFVDPCYLQAPNCSEWVLGF